MDKTKIIQVGILVRNIRRTAYDWAEFLGCEVPAISCTEKFGISHAVYRGQPCDGRIYQVAFRLGNIELELISPVDDEPSYWRECLEQNGEGIHHIAFYTREIEQDICKMKELGYVIRQEGKWQEQGREGTYAYVDTVHRLKCIVELLDFIQA